MKWMFCKTINEIPLTSCAFAPLEAFEAGLGPSLEIAAAASLDDASLSKLMEGNEKCFIDDTQPNNEQQVQTNVEPNK